MKSLFFILFFSVCLSATEQKTTPVHMTAAEAREFGTRWLPAWVGGATSVDRLLSFYSDDVVFVDPNTPHTGLRGKGALRRFLTTLLTKYPNWNFTPLAYLPTEKGFVMTYLGTIPTANTVVRNFRGVDMIEFKDGKISRQEGYYDRAPILEAEQPQN